MLKYITERPLNHICNLRYNRSRYIIYNYETVRMLENTTALFCCFELTKIFRTFLFIEVGPLCCLFSHSCSGLKTHFFGKLMPNSMPQRILEIYLKKLIFTLCHSPSLLTCRQPNMCGT